MKIRFGISLVAVATLFTAAAPHPPSEGTIEFKTKSGIGSMREGEALLTLQSDIGAEAGDDITVWLENPENSRGQLGPAGQWPEKWYASEAEMQNDRTQPDGTWASVIGKKGVMRFNTTWWDASNGSLDAGVPKALSCKVVSVDPDGRTLHLDKASLTTVSNVRVTFDNTNKMLEYVRRNRTFDAKDFGFKKGDTLWFGSDRLYWGYQPPAEWNGWQGWRAHNLKILGNDMTWASPPGTVPVCVIAEEGNGMPNFLVRDLNIYGGGTYQGLCLYWTALPHRNEAMDNPWIFSPSWGGWCRGATAINVTVTNPASYGFHGGFVDSCHIIITDKAIKHYNGWPFLVGKLTNSSFVSPHLMRAVEIEATDGGVVQNFRSVNGLFASNSSWNALFKNIDITITEGSAVANPAMTANPVFEIHGHIKGEAGNITVDGLRLTYEGFVGEGGQLLRDFSIKNGVTGVLLRDVTITKPPVPTEFGYGNGYGASLQSGCENLTLENFVTTGKMGWGFGCNGQGKDNAQFDIRGAGAKLRGVRGQFAIVPEDAVLECCKFECPVKRQGVNAPPNAVPDYGQGDCANAAAGRRAGSSEAVAGVSATPDKFTLSGFPNPFSKSTRLRYSLPVEARVNIQIFDFSGKEVTSAFSGNKAAGLYNLDVNTATLHSGVYYVRMTATADGGKQYVQTTKLLKQE